MLVYDFGHNGLRPLGPKSQTSTRGERQYQKTMFMYKSPDGVNRDFSQTDTHTLVLSAFLFYDTKYLSSFQPFTLSLPLQENKNHTRASRQIHKKHACVCSQQNVVLARSLSGHLSLSRVRTHTHTRAPHSMRGTGIQWHPLQTVLQQTNKNHGSRANSHRLTSRAQPAVQTVTEPCDNGLIIERADRMK